jgi:hypothetical protein
MIRFRLDRTLVLRVFRLRGVWPISSGFLSSTTDLTFECGDQGLWSHLVEVLESLSTGSKLET